MLAIVAPLQVSGLEPHEVADILRDGEVEASPIHGLGSLNHVSAMPGNEPVAAPGDRVRPWHLPDPYGVIAVVDSGVTEQIPAWLAEGLRFDPEDIEPTPGAGSASHGTFVAGIIRMISPNHVVSMVRARPIPTSEFLPPLENEDEGSPNLTSELDVMLAIVRLVDRHTGDAVDVLNLSLGGVACGEKDPTLVALSRAIDYWRQHFPRSVVFAAGGNTPASEKVFPAAFNHVRAVAAARTGGCWWRGILMLPDRGHQWTSHAAPGSPTLPPEST